MVIKDLHERVRPAGVIDVMRAISTAASVETPTAVDFTDAKHLSMCSAASFGVCNLLAGVLRDLVPFFKRNGRKAAFAVYRRRLDCQSRGQLHYLSLNVRAMRSV